MGVDSKFGIVTSLLESAVNAHLAQACHTVERGHPDSRQEVAKTNRQEVEEDKCSNMERYYDNN